MYFRGDAAFASPEMYEYLEAEGFSYAIRLPTNPILQESIRHQFTRPVGHPPNHVLRFYVGFSYPAGSWDRKRRVVAKVEWHPGELHPRVGFIITNLSRCAERVVGFYNQRGKAEQYIKGEARRAMNQLRHQVDAAFMPQVARQCYSAPASCPGLQSRQLHADAGLAEGSGALVADHVGGKASEDRREGGAAWPVRHLPTGRGGGAEGTVLENPKPDR